MARKEAKPNIKTTTPIVEILTYFTLIRFGIHRTHWIVRCRNEIFVLVKNAKNNLVFRILGIFKEVLSYTSLTYNK